MRKIRLTCAFGGLVLLAVNVFVCFSPWLSYTVQHSGSVTMFEEIAAPFITFVWACGGLYAFATVADSVSLQQVWSRLTTAFTIGWFAALFGVECTSVPVDPNGDPVIGVLIFAWSIAGAVCLLQELQQLERGESPCLQPA